MKNKITPLIVVTLLSLGIFSGFSKADNESNKSRTENPVQYESEITPGAVPEVLYYKFDEGGLDSTRNFALPGRGFFYAKVLGLSMGLTGQFSNALIGNGLSSLTNFVNTGWATDIGSSDWTISMWLSGLHSTSTLNYIFGDNTANSWRCFYSGAAGVNNVLLRLAVVGGTDITVQGVGPGPTVLTFVYDSSASTVYAYKNGVFSNSQPQAGHLNINGSGPFKIGGYSSSNGIPAGSLMDEFRFYSRALDTSEIALTWNQTLPVVSGIRPVSNVTPKNYYLSQNYPNPFNPLTSIKFDLREPTFAKLIIYNILGKEVTTLVNEKLNAGSYKVQWNATRHPSGVYFYKLMTNDYVDVKKMLLVE